MQPTRRELLVGSAALGAALVSGCRTEPEREPEPRVARTHAFQISLAQWSLHRALQWKRLEPLDFPLVARRDYGIDAVEYVNTFYKEHQDDDAHFAELAKRCRDHGVESRLIMIDGEGSLGAADARERAQAVANHRRWLSIARSLGCMAIRVNAAGEGSPAELRERVAESLHALGDAGDVLGLDVLVENHGGLSSNGAWLASVMKQAAHPRVGTLPDFGNFDLGNGQKYDRYKGVEELMPWARAVSAKSYDFDSAGDETTIDYRRMLKIVLAAGYRAHLGIEYEGERLSEPDGIRATQALLERLRAEHV
jgi:L-ribulose-5-phosphate 3-epimerase